MSRNIFQKLLITTSQNGRENVVLWRSGRRNATHIDHCPGNQKDWQTFCKKYSARISLIIEYGDSPYIVGSKLTL